MIENPRIESLRNRFFYDLPELIECESRIRKWAYQNAHTLVFVAIVSIVMWVVLIVRTLV